MGLEGVSGKGLPVLHEREMTTFEKSISNGI
jgi:hypothetical protein